MEVKEKKYYPINFRVKNWRKKNSFQSNRFEYDNRGSANGAAGLFFLLYLIGICCCCCFYSYKYTYKYRFSQSVLTIGANQRKANIYIQYTVIHLTYTIVTSGWLWHNHTNCSFFFSFCLTFEKKKKRNHLRPFFSHTLLSF